MQDHKKLSVIELTLIVFVITGTIYFIISKLGSLESGIETAANNGNSEAQYKLAEIYSNKKNFQEAEKWYTNAANNGNLEAQRRLAEIKFNKKDFQEAEKWYYYIATESGDTEALRKLAEIRLNKKDFQGAEKWYNKAAEGGDTEAQYILGESFFMNSFTELDYSKAAYFFKTAADSGHAEAQFKLGILHLIGEGVEKDYCAAVDLFKKSAKSENVDAEFYLAFCEINSCCTSFNDNTFTLLEKSAKSGNVDAMFYLSHYYRTYFIFMQMCGSEITRESAMQWSKYWKNKAISTNGHPDYDYTEKKECDKYHLSAAKWYRKAAQKGSAAAKEKLLQCGD